MSETNQDKDWSYAIGSVRFIATVPYCDGTGKIIAYDVRVEDWKGNWAGQLDLTAVQWEALKTVLVKIPRDQPFDERKWEVAL